MRINDYISESLRINEGFKNVLYKKEMYTYIDEVWDIFQRTYERIGGFKSAKTKDELIKKTHLLKMVKDKDGVILAVSVYKKKFGMKSFAKASRAYDKDYKVAAKKAVKKIYFEDIKTKRSWSESSGSSMSLQLTYGVPLIPNHFAKELTGKEILSYNEDGFGYVRIIGGEPHEKYLMGTPQGFEEKIKKYISDNNLSFKK